MLSVHYMSLIQIESRKVIVKITINNQIGKWRTDARLLNLLILLFSLISQKKIITLFYIDISYPLFCSR